MMSRKKDDKTSLDIMNIATIDLTFNDPTIEHTSSQQQNLLSKSSPSKSSPSNISNKKSTMYKNQKNQNPWWHMGTRQYHNDLKKEDPTDFSWTLRSLPTQGGLDFGLKLSGSTMPFSGRKMIFY